MKICQICKQNPPTSSWGRYCWDCKEEAVKRNTINYNKRKRKNTLDK